MCHMEMVHFLQLPKCAFNVSEEALRFLIDSNVFRLVTLCPTIRVVLGQICRQWKISEKLKSKSSTKIYCFPHRPYVRRKVSNMVVFSAVECAKLWDSAKRQHKI